ncbi:hypothetical protein JAAARDRAFT_317029 [Jaapia argillacea MUCL 33604]|uniref:Uncharacterized protein n=1 Tax=Jaapia argillacea MUCL 33604 TaxID=933084 RepID=A0A067PQ97_9AGAM|nr:hypothetical protein JAAARDRAFT_317029 [Jaapia argillacea MUCL 33604]
MSQLRYEADIPSTSKLIVGMEHNRTGPRLSGSGSQQGGDGSEFRKDYRDGYNVCMDALYLEPGGCRHDLPTGPPKSCDSVVERSGSPRKVSRVERFQVSLANPHPPPDGRPRSMREVWTMVILMVGPLQCASWSGSRARRLLFSPYLGRISGRIGQQCSRYPFERIKGCGTQDVRQCRRKNSSVG